MVAFVDEMLARGPANGDIRVESRCRLTQLTLDDLAIADPFKAVVRDITALRAQEQLVDTIVVTGLVYDVATGLVETVIAPAPLRLPEGQ